MGIPTAYFILITGGSLLGTALVGVFLLRIFGFGKKSFSEEEKEKIRELEKWRRNLEEQGLEITDKDWKGALKHMDDPNMTISARTSKFTGRVKDFYSEQVPSEEPYPIEAGARTGTHVLVRLYRPLYGKSLRVALFGIPPLKEGQYIEIYTRRQYEVPVKPGEDVDLSGFYLKDVELLYAVLKEEPGGRPVWKLRERKGESKHKKLDEFI